MLIFHHASLLLLHYQHITFILYFATLTLFFAPIAIFFNHNSHHSFPSLLVSKIKNFASLPTAKFLLSDANQQRRGLVYFNSLSFVNYFLNSFYHFLVAETPHWNTESEYINIFYSCQVLFHFFLKIFYKTFSFVLVFPIHHNDLPKILTNHHIFIQIECLLYPHKTNQINMKKPKYTNSIWVIHSQNKITSYYLAIL